MADVPRPRHLAFETLPDRVARVLSTLADAGHEVALVGGSVRDRLLGLPSGDDWDVATSARPEQVASLFAGATWENRFGTVTIGAAPAVEVTSYRTEGTYRDRRRPEEVRFGASLSEDLARRDFTINAVAWVPVDVVGDGGPGRLVDPYGGAEDLERRVLRAVGDARERFAEDALRLLRAARFAARFDLSLDPATEAAIVELAPTVTSVSAERVRDELLRMLNVEHAPSRAFLLLERLGLLAPVLPEVAALRGVPQAKAVPGDALDHTLATVDAVPRDAPDDTRLAALLHDIGKLSTAADGHFIGHESVGAEQAERTLRRLRLASGRIARITGAVRQHMYHYEPTWTDAAVRRFIRRTAEVDRELLFALRRADNAASGTAGAGEREQAELEGRIASQLDGHADLLLARRLAIDGHDLQAALGLEPGPAIGDVLERLGEAVLDDPACNERPTLLALAREIVEGR